MQSETTDEAARPIIPFRIDVAEADLVELRRRLLGTRWPDPETVDGWGQGVPLGWLQGLCRRWSEEYDWRRTESRLNQLPQFRTRLDGGGEDDLGVHFLHQRSPRPDATPLVLSHGWPGSFLEFEACLSALTDPDSQGRPGAPAFHVVVPSLPGYGFSERPRSSGWDVFRIARAWAELMERLGYRRFIAAGSDWGTSISSCLGRQHPERLLGLLLVPPLAAPDRDSPDLTDAERHALLELDERDRTGSGYGRVHGQTPQTVGYALTDSPAGLAGWVAEKIWLWSDRSASNEADWAIPVDRVLDNLSLYWFTATAASSARLYWESIAQVTSWFTSAADDRIEVPTGGVVFPREVPRASRRWAKRRFPQLVYWAEPERGGHFGAWEQPEIFVDQVRRFSSAVSA